MKKFTIQANDFLKQNTQAFYHKEYQGGGNWRIPGTIENIITTLKNDITPHDKQILLTAANSLFTILKNDLPQILGILNKHNFTICVVPRAKNENHYTENQKIFRKVVSLAGNKLNDFIDGTLYIRRHTNTRTTHRNRAGYGGDGDLPYPGITINTCNISPNVNGIDILLIDDLYTKTINIDEDAIQALLDNGANSVNFYSIGYTVR